MRILGWILLFSNILQAAELVETYTSVRALGMGNAYTAVVSDKYSLFYNPAGLARVKGLNVTLIGVQLGVDGTEIADTIKDASDEDKYVETLKKYYGKNLWVGFGGLSAVTLPGFGAAAYDFGEVAAHLSNPAFPNLNVRYINDFGFSGGVAVDILPTVHAGIVGSRITRTGGQLPIGVSTLGTLSQEDLRNQINNVGTAYSATAGIVLGIPTPAFPRVSFVYKNIGQTTFSKDSGNMAPPPIMPEMIAGLAWDIHLPLITITNSIDFKHIDKTDEQIGKKIHFGSEVAFPIFAVRGGFHQGYYTLGAGVDLPFIKVDAATYGVELGEYPGQRQDRRYILSATIEFGFDPSFSFLKGSGKGGGGSSGPNRGLKPRR